MGEPMDLDLSPSRGMKRKATDAISGLEATKKTQVNNNYTSQ